MVGDDDCIIAQIRKRRTLPVYQCPLAVAMGELIAENAMHNHHHMRLCDIIAAFPNHGEQLVCKVYNQIS